jgi:5'-methylthioadenosine phosphorylase
MDSVQIGIIGGSGLYNMAELTDRQTLDIDTPFGKPSAPVVLGMLRGHRAAFIPRHGIGHRFMPTEVPYRANIFALKLLGVTHVISVSACGSLREDYAPGHIVIPDQIFDMTHRRIRSFFGEGLVAHVSAAEPFSQKLSSLLYETVQEAGSKAHLGGTLINVEGPRFSTKGESHTFRKWGMSVIGMTTSPEAFLAREAEMHYAVMAHVTDYDCWHEGKEPVTVDMVIAVMHKNLEVAQRAVALAVERLAASPEAYTEDGITNAMATAFLTDRRVIPVETWERLLPIIGKYFKQ